LPSLYSRVDGKRKGLKAVAKTFGTYNEALEKVR